MREQQTSRKANAGQDVGSMARTSNSARSVPSARPRYPYFSAFRTASRSVSADVSPQPKRELQSWMFAIGRVHMYFLHVTCRNPTCTMRAGALDGCGALDPTERRRKWTSLQRDRPMCLPDRPEAWRTLVTRACRTWALPRAIMQAERCGRGGEDSELLGGTKFSTDQGQAAPAQNRLSLLSRWGERGTKTSGR